MIYDVETEEQGATIWFGIALVLQAVTAFFYLASGLVAPMGPLIAMWCLWVALTYMLIRWRREGPRILLLPAVTIALWFGILSAGEAFLGWTA